MIEFLTDPRWQALYAEIGKAAVFIGLTVLTMRAFVWPRFVRKRIDNWANHETAEQRREIKALRRELTDAYHKVEDLQAIRRAVLVAASGE